MPHANVDDRRAADRARYVRSERYKGQQRASYLRRKYGIDEDQALALLAEQGGVCAICSKPITFGGQKAHIDHDHVTGKVRGILCLKCNQSLGGFGDTAEGLRKALAYLER